MHSAHLYNITYIIRIVIMVKTQLLHANIMDPDLHLPA